MISVKEELSIANPDIGGDGNESEKFRKKDL